MFGLPDNTSVQSVSLGLVNNQLPHLLTAVPLPAPALLLVAPLVLVGRRRCRV